MNMSNIRTAVPRVPAGWKQVAKASSSLPVASRRRREVTSIAPGEVDLVAPPDPFSNIRPVIYASAQSRRPSNSPYSAAEFPTSGNPLQDELELRWTMHRQRVDATNHRFWATTNADFHAQMNDRISRLPPASDPPTEADVQRREECLAQFYRDWQIGNRERQEKWVKDWWRDIWLGLKLQASVYIGRMTGR